MTEQASLRTRFFAYTRDRARMMVPLVTELGTESGPRALARVRHELHTIKGEARMVGVEAMAALSHVLEELLLGTLDAAAVERVSAGIDALLLYADAAHDGRALPEQQTADLVAALRAHAQPRPAPPTRAATPAPAPPAQRPSEPVTRMLQVSASAVDTLTDLAGEVASGMIQLRTDLAGARALVVEARQLVHRALATTKHSSDLSALAAVVERLARSVRTASDGASRTDVTFGNVARGLLASRLQPFRSLLVGYPALVRRTAQESGRQARVQIVGADTELDQPLLDQIADPLLHLVTNAVVHGIEPPDERVAAGKPTSGTVSIEITQEDGDRVRLRVSDDGRGIDVERVRDRAVAMGLVDAAAARTLDDAEVIALAYAPGLSTALSTDEAMGRGIGLDAVKTVMDRVGGTIEVDSAAGRGTTFTLRFPASVAAMRVMVVQVGTVSFALAASAVVELVRVPVDHLCDLDGGEAIVYRDSILPVARIREVLGLTGIKDLFVNQVSIVVLRDGNSLAGFVVDGFKAEREVVVRPLPAFLAGAKVATGVTVMERGEVVLLLRVPTLFQALPSARRGRVSAPATATTAAGPRVLYAEDSMITREYVTGVLRSLGYSVEATEDGVAALAVLQRETFDLLLTDLQMPNMDGFQLIRAIRSGTRQQGLPIIVMSTLDGDEAKRMALDMGADGYLVKGDYSPDALARSIRQLIGR